MKKDEVFILKESLDEVKSFVEELMIITEGEKKFIDRFYNGGYCTELLFGDKKILDWTILETILWLNGKQVN